MQEETGLLGGVPSTRAHRGTGHNSFSLRWCAVLSHAMLPASSALQLDGRVLLHQCMTRPALWRSCLTVCVSELV